MAWRRIARLLGIYKIYENILEREVKRHEVPRHIGFILDGNRRWARKHRLPPWLGHKAGADKVDEVLDWCYDLGVETVTLYVLSVENLKRRSREEISALLGLIEDKVDDLLSTKRLEKRGVRFKVIGRADMLPQSLREKLALLEERTSRFNKRYLNLAIAYGGRNEIVDAAKKIAEEVARKNISLGDVDEELFEQYLYTGGLPHPNPDLVIRTSGEVRISNFLLWQIAYSELFFLDVYWPEFRRIDLLRAIRAYQKRQRRFGA